MIQIKKIYENKFFVYFARFLPYIFIGAIFFFLVRLIRNNWIIVKNYDLSFNYYYLSLSFLLLVISIVVLAFIWRRILCLLSHNRLSVFSTLRIFVYSMFGKYLPGQIWMPVGKIYLGAKEGFKKDALALSVVYEILLSIMSSFIVSLILLSVFFRELMRNFSFLPIIILVFCLVSIILIPKVFNKAMSLLKIRLGSDNFDFKNSGNLGALNIFKIMAYYCLAYVVNGMAFFFFIRSLAPLSMSHAMGIVGGVIFANVIGMVAFFAPAGLGVRDGILTMFLGFYFPIGVATVLALAARIWATLAELFLLLFIFLYSEAGRIFKVKRPK